MHLNSHRAHSSSLVITFLYFRIVGAPAYDYPDEVFFSMAKRFAECKLHMELLLFSSFIVLNVYLFTTRFIFYY